MLSNITTVIYRILWTAFIISVLVMMIVLHNTLAEMPITSYSIFVVWSLLLSMWSYYTLKEAYIFEGKDVPMYTDQRNRHGVCFISLGLIWFLVYGGFSLEGPTTGEYGDPEVASVMTNLAVEYFGQWSTYDGYSVFNFYSDWYFLMYFILSIVPPLILTIGGRAIYSISKERILNVQRADADSC